MFKKKKLTVTSKAVVGLGILATALGRRIGGRIGSGITGFGLAHIFLGTLAKLRML